MSLLVVGSVAIDNILTPVQRRDDVLGGAGTYASFAASFFLPVDLVGVVGDDFPMEHLAMLKDRGIDTAGVEVRRGEKTFRWTGRYLENMNDRETLETQLNVLGTPLAPLPDHLRRCRYVFLGNASPSVQLQVVDQIQGAELVTADTMNLWIDTERETLDALMKRIDGLILNDSEAKMMTGESNIVTAGRRILDYGPRFVVMKKGEHGSMFFSRHETYAVPAFPTETVVDPTGAGDAFAGAMMGYFATHGMGDALSIKRGLVFGSLLGSITVQGFGLEKLREFPKEELEKMLATLRQMTEF